MYDEYYDCVLFPENRVLKYSTTNRDGYRKYKSNAAICNSCPKLYVCSKNHQKVVQKHIWDNYYFRHSTVGNRQSMAVSIMEKATITPAPKKQKTEREKNSRSGKAQKRSTPWWNASLSSAV